MTAGAEGHPLSRIVWVRSAFIVLALEAVEIDEQFFGSRFSCEGGNGYGA